MPSRGDFMKITLVILTLDEIDGVRALFPKLADLSRLSVDEIIAVDGGSTDGTRECIEASGIRLCDQKSKGRGEAFRVAAQVSDADFLIFFSPDGNEDWKDISRFRKFFEQGYNLVIASRMMEGAHNEEDDELFRFRKWANNVFNWLANQGFRRSGPYITDSINGFRGVKRSLVSELGIAESGFTVEYQMTIRALASGERIVEFPTNEGPRIGGEIKARSIPTGLRFLRCLVAEILGSGKPGLRK